ncbi:RHS repeat-associated core domain-containing protein [Aliikangiella maris]|uniref:RHS repeat-associated core domain-containing protein n=2 Tax=Aliikangiella maris TaxID=3162458 RepID=A0ABV3MT62_9GAMM
MSGGATQQSTNQIVGDFNGDNQDDVLNQARVKGARSSLSPWQGYNVPGFHINWTSTYLGLTAIDDWSAEQYGAYSGNFNANPGDELLMLGKTKMVLLHGDIVTPMAISPPVKNAIISWDSNSNPKISMFEIDANPSDFIIHFADFNGNGFDEILLQAKFKGRSSYLINGNGSIFQELYTGYNGMDWSAETYDFTIEDINGDGIADITAVVKVGGYSDTTITFDSNGVPSVNFDYPVNNPNLDITYFHFDHLGSTIGSSDGHGNIEYEHYEPFGRPVVMADGNGNEQWYNSKPYDYDTGLSYYGSRYYDSEIGRFVSIDPAPVLADSPRSFGRYTYTINNPYKYVDPDGELIWFAALWFVGDLAAYSGVVVALDVLFVATAVNIATSTNQNHTSPSANISDPFIPTYSDSFGPMYQESSDEESKDSDGATDLPENPDDLLEEGYEETSDPRAKKKDIEHLRILKLVIN